MNKLENDIKKEVKKYKEEILSNNLELYDNKPFIQKAVFILVGISNFLVGYTLYFFIKDKKNMKWQAGYLSAGASIGLVISLINIVAQVVAQTIEKVA